MTREQLTLDDSRHAALASENQRLTAALAQAQARIVELEKLAREDGLTGLLNRRSFDIELARAFEFHTRYQEDMALVVLDLDDFKTVNDTHGHMGGDALLKHVARLLVRNTRGSDIAARIGGDEFALILRRIDGSGSATKTEALREALANFPTISDGKAVYSSVSAGCAPLLSAYTSPDQWFAAADAALYADKARQKSARHIRR